MQYPDKKIVAPRYRRHETDVPILVPCGDQRPDAYATFIMPQLGKRPGIRVLGPGDFHDMALRTLSKGARCRLRELVALRQGLEEEDPSYWLRRFGKEKAREKKLQEKIAALHARDVKKTGRPSSRTARLMGLAELKEDPLSFLSCTITEKLSRARLVLWWKGQPRVPTYRLKLKLWSRTPQRRLPAYPGRVELVQRVAHLMYWRNREQFVPAIFCPDLETAFYVYALFEVTGRGLGICLHCGEVFQKLRPDSLYCCFSHGEAYRLQRWRAVQRKKAREKK